MPPVDYKNLGETIRLVAFLAVIGVLSRTGALGHTETVGLLTALLGYAFGQHSGEARANAGRAAVAASQAAQAAATDAHAIVVATANNTPESAETPEEYKSPIEHRSTG